MLVYCNPVINFHIPFFTANSPEEENFFDVLDLVFLPLLNVFENWEDDAVDYAFTLIISPSFLCALNSPNIMERYAVHLRTALGSDKKTYPEDYIKNLLFWFEKKYNSCITTGLQRLACYNHLEIITSAATNAVLPLLSPVPQAVNSQIAIGLAFFSYVFSIKTSGFSLPDTSFYSDISTFCKKQNITWIITSINNLKKNLPDSLFPLWSSPEIAVFIPNSYFSTKLCHSLTECNISANDISSSIITSLQSTVKNINTCNNELPPIYTLYIDAAEIVSSIKENKQPFVNWDLINLLIRKICYDQDIIKTIKPSSYILNNPNIAAINGYNLEYLSNNLTQFYQKNYQRMFPDLHLATIKLINNKKENCNQNILEKMIRLLLLAQNGDNKVTVQNISDEYNNMYYLRLFSELDNLIHDNPESANNLPLPIDITNVFPNINLLSFY